MRKMLLAIGLLMLSTPVQASGEGESVAFVAALRGEVIAIAAAGDERRLALKSPVYREDTVRTGPGGRLQLVFADNTMITLGRLSEMKVADYRWDPAKGSGAMKTRVSEGFFRVMGGAISRTDPGNFSTETPAATIGIRGSMYAGRVSAGTLVVVFQGGRGIIVSNDFGRVEIDRPGFGTRVEEADRPPQSPARFSGGELSDLDQELTAAPDSAGDGAAETLAEVSGEEGDSAAGTVAGEATETPAEPSSAPVPAGATVDGASLATVVVDSTQTTLTTTATGTAATAPPASVSLSGRYLSVLGEQGATNSPGTAAWFGAASATAAAGAVSGTAVAQDGTVFPFALAIPVHDPGAAYGGPQYTTGLTRLVTLLGAERTFPAMEVGTSNLGEFALFSTAGSFAETATYDFQELVFVGVPATGLPVDGVANYSGLLLGFSRTEPGGSILDPIEPGSFTLGVNWHNRKVFGAVYDAQIATDGTTKTDAFFFGELSGTGTTNVRVIGSEFDPTATGSFEPRAIVGSGSFGQFYGSAAQGFGLTAEGSVFAVYDQGSPRETWQVAGAALREVAAQSAATGQALRQGFVVGVAEDMDAPNYGRRLFLNSDASSFSLTVDRDAGTVSGSLSARDAYDPANQIVGLEVGGAQGSAYLADQALIAVLGGGSVRSGAASGGFKAYGNFMVTEGDDPDGQFIDHASWGYWEAAYVDPAGGQQYHVHVPGSLWVAGEPTPAADVAALAATRFVGTYNGSARGVHISPTDPDPALSQRMTELTGGSATLTVDFDPAASVPVQGQLSFVEATLDVVGAPGSIGSGGFAAGISGAASSQVNGSFYGPGAASVGGNFDAQFGSGDRYLGIFGGNR